MMRRYTLRYRKSKNYLQRLQHNLGGSYIEASAENKGRWSSFFGNDNEIVIEIGCGKGGFLLELAKRNPSVNYIGIEKSMPLLTQTSELIHRLGLANIKLTSFNASEIMDFFENEEVSSVYLNFSDPWPKARHYKRRLTSEGFLTKYSSILKAPKKLYFKTDNTLLFEFTLIELSKVNADLKDIDMDLHGKDIEKDSEKLILTEYEKRFMQQGIRIYRLEAELNDAGPLKKGM